MTQLIEKILNKHFGNNIKLFSAKPVSGGCINNAFALATSKGNFFLKTNSAAHYPHMFEKEKLGLKLIADTHTIAVPEVLFTDILESHQYILMQYIERGYPAKNFWQNFAESLYALHNNTSDRYGLFQDNYIGSLTQCNYPKSNWIEFFIQYRLLPQIKSAQEKGYIENKLMDKFEKLFFKLNDILWIDQPSLLHGDLWSGNFMIKNDGNVCLIDPAVYYGHREAELAFTTLFGGFDQKFYEVYHSLANLPVGYQERYEIYNLYPLLVHLNLFGLGYLNSIKNILNLF
ncbi:MAG: fructosamine kinase family protein [Cytophagaceae bacterium]|nr:fructosamine kinase family protein [Cytophagaceae bacterium]MDW8457254.1 fructosamine kinase family protein [Cytophagaceae bacterium]